MESICVFILAENRLLREALSRFLSKKSDIRVVGSSAFSTRIVEQIARLKPHVLLSDFAAFVLSDLQFIREMRTAVPGLKIVLIGMKADGETLLHVVRDGAYVLKDASAVEVADAVRSIAGR